MSKKKKMDKTLTEQEKAYQLPIPKVWKMVGSHSVRALRHRKECTHAPPCWAMHEHYASFYQKVVIMRDGMKDKKEKTGKAGFKITEMYAIISVEEDGTEGIIARGMPNGTMMPFVGADLDRIGSLMPFAEDVSKKTNLPYKVYKFKDFEDVTEIMKTKYLNNNDNG